MKRCLAVLLCLMLICGVSFAEDAVSSATLAIDRLPQAEEAGGGTLVVFFSPDETVRAAAYVIAAAVPADLFEIVPAEPYTADDLNYSDHQSRSMKEYQDPSARPAIAALPEDLGRYDTIILGYPIWYGQAPKIVRTFLESVDLSGKTIIPFCTSGASGIEKSVAELQTLTDDTVVWQEGTRLPKGSTAEEISAWVKELKIR